MKKTKYVFIPIILICLVMSLFATACLDRLATPEDVSINLDNYTLSWARVENARSYEIEITPADGDSEYVTVSNTKVSYSLQALDEGDYEVRIRASAGTSKTYSDSLWSDAIYLNKDYYSGCTFSLINNATEYEITGWTKPGNTTAIMIPRDYRDKPVVGIAENAFKSKSTLTSVEFEEGSALRYVGKNAFYSCTRLESITLPDTVTEIGEGAFHSCRVLTSFVVPEGVTTLEDSTFLYCRALEYVDLGNVESIGDSAFLGCNGEGFTSVVIPDTVTTIGEKAFSDCTALESVTVGSGIEEIGSYAFYKDTSLKTVSFKNGENGGTALEEIGSYAFSGCTSLASVSLPQGLESIDTYAFYNDTALEDINIPDSVTGIGSYAFGNTALYENQSGSAFVYVGLDRAKAGDGNSAWVVGFNSENLPLTDGKCRVEETDIDGAAVGMADRAFYRETALEYVNIPATIHYIGNYAFYGCTKVSDVIIMGAREWPEDVVIGSYAFASMSILSNFKFASSGRTSGVKSVGDHAFYNDTLLESVDIPDSLESVGAYAFTGSGIFSMTYSSSTGNGLDETNQVVYAGKTNKWVVGYGDYITEVTLESGTCGIADYAFTRDTALRTLTGLGNVKHIGEGAFYKCTSLTNASVPEEADEIKSYTFYGCESLVSIGSGLYGISTGLTSIGRSAFYGCKSLNGLDLSYSHVRYIGKYAFYNCTSLYSMNFGEYLEEIDDFAFYKAGLMSVEMPDSLERIGDKAFYKCTGLETVDFGGGVETLGEYAFYKCEALEEINIPGSVKSIGDYCFYKCEAAECLNLEEGLGTIGKGSFASLTGITSLHIPSSVREIGNYAFKSCKNLKSIIIPKTVEIIGDNAFYGITDATFYTDADEYLPQWSVKLNSSYRPMVWGCGLSEDGTHVVSIRISSGSVANVIRIEGNEETEDDFDEAEDEQTKGKVNYSRLCAAPEWEGHVFAGWSLTPDGSVEYDADEIDFVFDERGEVVLYAVWEDV